MKTSTDPYTLKILFAGICTHFKGVVAGVPHRVVLPDATRIRTGFISVVDDTPPILYYLTPHFPTLHVLPPCELTLPGPADHPRLIEKGDIRLGVRLQVINAVDDHVTYVGGDSQTPSLTTFMPDYNISDDVVLNGRASCYLDIFGGQVRTLAPLCTGGPTQILIQIQTDGPPELLVTPLLPLPTQSDSPPFKSQRLCLAAHDVPREIVLFVSNLESFFELGDEQGGGSFDYLLHYLTARGGIPLSIAQRTPGMGSDPLVAATPDDIGRAIEGLGGLLRGGPSLAAINAAIIVAAAQLERCFPPNPPTTPMFLTPSCSDSQYP